MFRHSFSSPFFASVTLHHTVAMCGAGLFLLCSLILLSFSQFIQYCFFLCLKLLHISSQLICLHKRSHFSVSYSVTSQPIYVSVLSHFCFSLSLSHFADSIMGQVSPEGLLSRLQTEGANTEAESEVSHHLFYDQLVFSFVILMFTFSLLVKLSGLKICG